MRRAVCLPAQTPLIERVAAESIDWLERLCSELLVNGTSAQWWMLTATATFWRRQRIMIRTNQRITLEQALDYEPTDRSNRSEHQNDVAFRASTLSVPEAATS